MVALRFNKKIKKETGNHWLNYATRIRLKKVTGGDLWTNP